MKFKYFESPELYVGCRETEVTCDICRQRKICFNGESFFGTQKLRSICPECLGSGKLNDLDSFTCDGDLKNLKGQLRELHPNLTDEEIHQIAGQKSFELEKTTPHLITWQDWSWPCADGDYCKFIGYGSKPLYKSLAKDITVEEFFKNSFYEPESYYDGLWTDAVPEQSIQHYEESNQYSTLFYVFKSLHSDSIITIWDCD
ncbi:hypothetical protein PBAL39_15634 [Pedobacter sp. BAL39]|uniref:CbrC family protein n=1 Tax=Pedobacter sp. BAL39 TaxID=391596 RepID=UPI0001559EDC|nr:CbrC family protein [Pedobacter sp. BAL39]EDM37870.1 hypothetical protein PBAL39_15634 [Pedobacter sp. BAL39]